MDVSVAGIPCIGLNGGAGFKHGEALSCQIAADDPAETDWRQNAVVGNGGQESACGRYRDRWGLSWQVTPRVLTQAVTSKDPAVARRALAAMLTLRKIDVTAVEAAVRG